MTFEFPHYLFIVGNTVSWFGLLSIHYNYMGRTRKKKKKKRTLLKHYFQYDEDTCLKTRSIVKKERKGKLHPTNLIYKQGQTRIRREGYCSSGDLKGFTVLHSFLWVHVSLDCSHSTLLKGQAGFSIKQQSFLSFVCCILRPVDFLLMFASDLWRFPSGTSCSFTWAVPVCFVSQCQWVYCLCGTNMGMAPSLHHPLSCQMQVDMELLFFLGGRVAHTMLPFYCLKIARSKSFSCIHLNQQH